MTEALQNEKFPRLSSFAERGNVRKLTCDNLPARDTPGALRFYGSISVFGDKVHQHRVKIVEIKACVRKSCFHKRSEIIERKAAFGRFPA